MFTISSAHWQLNTKEHGIDVALEELFKKEEKKVEGANQDQDLASDLPCSELPSPCTLWGAVAPRFQCSA